MTEFSFQYLIRRFSRRKQAEMLTFREIKKHLQTNKKHKQIKTSQYVAELDWDFCAGAEPCEFIEQIDMLMDGGRILKTGDATFVSNITWNNKDIVVKRYDNKGFIHSLRHTIKKSRARKGWLYAHLLGVLDIDTPKALAYIEQRRGLLIWQSYLVTQYIEGENLWLFLRDNDVTEQRKKDVIQQVVRLLDKLWKSRITHGDLKHTNVLVTENGPVLTDLDGMIVHRWELLYRNKQAKDMERFIRKTSISPALNNYCQLLISIRKDSCNKLPEDFESMQMDRWIICIRKDFPKNFIGNVVSENYSSFTNREQFTRVPSSNYTRVFTYRVSFDGVDHSFYLKEYLCRSALDLVKHLFRPSRARRAFNAALILQKNGFDTPAVMGLFEHRTGPFCTNNLLLTEEVENSKPMPQLLADICQNSDVDTFIHKRALIKAFGRTIGRMHSEGIFHGDLRLGNILVVREEGKWRFFFIDNERTKKFGRLPDKLRLKNLVQINMFRTGITNSDRLRFFKAYLISNPDVQARYNRWMQKIYAKTNRRLSKKDRLKN
jgi:tRNA A-37 threonylcarbamoyl transferase component Bud32